MKKLSYLIDFKKAKWTEADIEASEKTGHKAIFENIATAALSSRYQSGVGAKSSRIYARILDKLDNSTDGTLMVEEAEYDLLKEIFLHESAKFEARAIRLASQYIENIEKAEEVKI